MSDIIPPLLSNTPPPPPLTEEDEDDEFGDFTGANDISYGCDNLSLPPSPVHLPDTVSILNGLDINSNADKNKISQIDLGAEKDFQDKRKAEDGLSEHTNSIKHSCIENVHKKELFFEHSINDDFHIGLSSTKNNLEIYKAPLDSNECIKNEKQDNLEGTVNNYDNHKISEEDEVLTKNLENRSDDFVNNDDCNTKEIVDETNINELEKDSKVVTENNILENKENIVNDIEGRECIPVLSVLEKSCADSEEISESDHSIKEQSVKQNNVNDCPLQNVPSTEEIMTRDVKSSQEIEDVPRMIMTTEKETDSGSHEENVNDNFDNFAFASIPEYSSIEINNESETIDEFSDFTEAAFNKTEQKETGLKSNFAVNDDDHFGDFSSHSIFPESSVDIHVIENSEFDDDFGEFACTTAPAVQPEWSNVHSSTQDDDFGNFADFAEVAKESVVLTLDEKQAFEKAEIIVKDMFPSPDSPQDDFLYVDVEKHDVVFNELKDITETPALLYQWSKSSSQKLLLKSLNIDARNILYGPPWNPSMPRFAANLGLKPLEPVKSEILTPTPLKSSPSITVQSANVDIPNAQFDWNSSGLVNPLDYSQTMLLDLELVASLEIPTSSTSSNNSISPTTELDEWDIWLQSVSKENLEPSSPSDMTPKPLELSIEPSLILQPKLASPPDELRKEPSKTDLEQKSDNDFEDFTSFQSSQLSQAVSWPSIPLRETYISNDNITANISKEIPLDIEGWLQPTIVTPELPRKDLSLGDEELPDVQTPELSRKNVGMESLDDDFDDFKIVLPNEQSPNADIPAFSGILEPTKSESNMPDVPVNVDGLNFSQVDIPNLNFVKDQDKTEAPKKEEPNKRSLELEVVEENVTKPIDEDDEFTDFHSFTPIAQQATPKALTPILEPLKPVPVFPTVQYPVMSTSQINWPDPGVTDEEIKKFEIVFSQSQISKPEPLRKEETQPIKEEAQMGNTAEDDEWSDFVSVQKPSPVHKFQSNEREHTSSPDLPLSVLNLGNIQPAKQPIPVITPHGLVQTKLSSNNPVNMSPKTHLKLAPHQKLTNHPHSQPSIISNQFATQAYNFNSYAGQSKTALNATSSNSGNNDDDDWSDFVSSPLPPSTSNGYQQTWQNSLPYQNASWTNPSPNIIMNPGHFVQTRSDLRNRKVPTYPVTNKKNTVTNISMPDLEFIAPKGRTSSSRRK